MNAKAYALEGCMVEDDPLLAVVQKQLDQPLPKKEFMTFTERVKSAVEKRVTHLQQGITLDTVKYIVSGETDESVLHQMATDRAVDGDYLGAIICEEAAKIVK